MCGVAGVYAWSERAAPVELAELEGMSARLAHRGPDGAGLWRDASARIGFAHRRLAIIDLTAAGAQPMRDAQSALCITYNGEIYNYKELRAELEARGTRFVSASDTEVLLHLYAAQGVAMLDKLRGMFAFAIWDERRRHLFLARDPFGIKPLYYHEGPGTLRFASQVSALLGSASVCSRLNPAAEVGFFLFGSVPEPETIVEGVKALAAGSWLRIGPQGPEPLRFHASIRASLRTACDEAKDPGLRRNAIEIATEAVATSVRHHLIADVPLGVFLSAGLDSTMLAGAAAAITQKPVRTLTLAFDKFVGTPFDERPGAERIARHLGSDQSVHWTTRKDFEEALPGIIQSMDQPSIDGVNTYFASRALASRGGKVALSGLGGDELFGGYSTFRTVPRLVRYAGPLARIPGLGRATRIITAPLIEGILSPKFAGLIEYGCDLPSAYLLNRGLFMPWELSTVLDRDVVRAGLERLAPLKALQSSIAGLDNDEAIITTLETCWYMRNQLLRDADWASMAHAIELRTPFVDWHLFKTLAPLIVSGTTPQRRSLAARLVPDLPRDALERPKTGFSIPIPQWWEDCGEKARAGRRKLGGLREWSLFVHRQFCDRIKQSMKAAALA